MPAYFGALTLASLRDIVLAQSVFLPHRTFVAFVHLVSFSRNPIYVAFALVLSGEFLIFANWILLVYLAAGIWLLHCRVLREEDCSKKHHGAEYLEYSKRVRRYL